MQIENRHFFRELSGSIIAPAIDGWDETFISPNVDPLPFACTRMATGVVSAVVRHKGPENKKGAVALNVVVGLGLTWAACASMGYKASTWRNTYLLAGSYVGIKVMLPENSPESVVLFLIYMTGLTVLRAKRNPKLSLLPALINPILIGGASYYLCYKIYSVIREKVPQEWRQDVRLVTFAATRLLVGGAIGKGVSKLTGTLPLFHWKCSVAKEAVALPLGWLFVSNHSPIWEPNQPRR